MGHSQRLRLSEIRQVFRLIGDVREHRHQPIEQERLIVDGLVGLLGASYGFAVSFSGFRPDAKPVVTRNVLGTQQDPVTLRYLSTWSRTSTLSEDPMVVETCGIRDRAVAFAHSSRLDIGDRRYARIYREYWDPARVQDMLVTFFRYPGTDAIRGYSFQLTGASSRFSERSVRLARLFSVELLHLHRAGRLEPSAPFADLPERLRRFAPMLLTGMSQKQISSKTGLS